MKTKVTFKVLSDRKVIQKTLEIEHPRFEEIPEQMFNGIKLPRTSIESQVIDYLDSIDKRDLMVENDFDIIIDYWPCKKRSKNGKDKEIKEFIKFCKPYLTEICPRKPTRFSGGMNWTLIFDFQYIF